MALEVVVVAAVDEEVEWQMALVVVVVAVVAATMPTMGHTTVVDEVATTIGETTEVDSMVSLFPMLPLYNRSSLEWQVMGLTQNGDPADQ